MTGYAVIAVDEESASPLHSARPRQKVPRWRMYCPWATSIDIVIIMVLLIAATVVVIFGAIKDWQSSQTEPCDPLKMPKHHHCVPPLKPRTFADVLDAQGTDREHYSVIEKQRAAASADLADRHIANADRKRIEPSREHPYDAAWVDPLVMDMGHADAHGIHDQAETDEAALG